LNSKALPCSMHLHLTSACAWLQCNCS